MDAERRQAPPAEQRPQRIVMLCDWLPPDFGAVGQYALGFARELAGEGHDVTLVGFSSRAASEERDDGHSGSLVIRRLHRPAYDRGRLLARALWSLGANASLIWGAWRELRRADEVRFTGSPPYLLHFIAPVARLLGVRTRYRITDFHPECLIAMLDRPGLGLRLLSSVTGFWRRRIDVIEVLGHDQGRRLVASRVRPERIVLRRDPSPVEFPPDVAPATPPAAAAGRAVILYSGNWGVAHDHATFIEGYARYTRAHPDRAFLWLNATGGRINAITAALEADGLPYARTAPVPLERLPGVLRAADVHLITLDDRFVGYVMPSKVYACIASRRPILFIGSSGSDVHELCEQHVPAGRYRRVDVGDPTGVADAIAHLLDADAGAITHYEQRTT